MKPFRAIALMLLIAGCAEQKTEAPPPPPPPPVAAKPADAPLGPVDYADDKNWLCLPGHKDACAADLTTTSIDAEGRMTRELFKADDKAKIDCFYVYPTISKDPGGNSTMKIAAEDLIVIKHQFARLGAVCRTFAPKYRQVTLAALYARVAGHPIPTDPDLALGDVRAAWQYYLAHENHGRGVVLIGHSQGAGILTRLIKSDIDGKPIQKQLVSAILMGTNLPVPKGADIGGAFKSIPLCKGRSQIGCAIAFVSFRADEPPPPNSRFGKVPEAGMAAACVNPAAPAGGLATLKSYLPAHRETIATEIETVNWVDPPKEIETPFVRLPGLVHARCVSDDAGTYLAVSVKPQKKDRRTHKIPGDVVFNGKIQPDWGLHLIDVNLVMGNLLDVIAAESKAYRAVK